VLFLLGVFLAVFVLPSPWGLVAIVVGGLLDIAETGLFLWWSRRRRASVGVESLVGRTGIASTALWPEGQVRIAGELWGARCEGGCDPGTSVVVRAIEGLTLVVEAA
jgi:membrane protein implicated in regulation of membrane protease activity